MNAPDEIIFNDRRVISHMTVREKEIYRYGFMAAQVKIATDIEALAVYLVDDQSEPGGPSIIHRAVSLESVLDIARGESNGA